MSEGVEVEKLIWLIFDIHFQFEVEFRVFRLLGGELKMSQFAEFYACAYVNSLETT